MATAIDTSKMIVMPPEYLVGALVDGYKACQVAGRQAATEYLADAMYLQAATYKSILIMMIGCNETTKLLSDG